MELDVSSNHLLFWEKKGHLKSQIIRAGDNTLVIYTPELIGKAKK